MSLINPDKNSMNTETTKEIEKWQLVDNKPRKSLKS